MDAISLTQRGQRGKRIGTRVEARSSFGRILVALFSVCLLALPGIVLAGCAWFDEPLSVGTHRADSRASARSALLEDGPVFVGSAPRVPGSYAKLVLEKNFPETRKLRWRSNDAQIGGTEVDFFTPHEWKLEGDPPRTLSFGDRSPGPVLLGEIGLAPDSRATVTVVLGRDRVTYWLERVDGDGTR